MSACRRATRCRVRSPVNWTRRSIGHLRWTGDVAAAGDEPDAPGVDRALSCHLDALLACEGATLGAAGGDARRMLLARMVVDHRLRASDPLAIPRSDDAMVDALLSDEPVSLSKAADLVAA